VSFRERYGPWALVAGASDGIGEAFARRIAERGLNVLLLARRAPLLERLAAEISAAHGVEARPLVADLTAADLDARVEAATRGLEVGLLVYNAGAEHAAGPFHDTPVAHAQQLVALNCTGPVLLAHRLGARCARTGAAASCSSPRWRRWRAARTSRRTQPPRRSTGSSPSRSGTSCGRTASTRWRRSPA
jgi:short-subunit dehydrogenase